LKKRGEAMAASTPRITMTVTSSTNVNPRDCRRAVAGGTRCRPARGVLGGWEAVAPAAQQPSVMVVMTGGRFVLL
jgi:hypothetical protein